MTQSVTKAALSAVLSAAVAIPALAAENTQDENNIVPRMWWDCKGVFAGEHSKGSSDSNDIINKHIAEERPGNLSPRELEVLKYLALGKTFEEIAIICGVGTETVKTHTKNLRAKLDAPTSIAAVSRAYELGILRP